MRYREHVGWKREARGIKRESRLSLLIERRTEVGGGSWGE